MRSHIDSIDTTHTPPPLSFYNTFNRKYYIQLLDHPPPPKPEVPLCLRIVYCWKNSVSWSEGGAVSTHECARSSQTFFSIKVTVNDPVTGFNYN
jgi:hypothetical protein